MNIQGACAPLRCCFCAVALVEEEPGLLTLIVVAVPRAGSAQSRSQQLWCHARCLDDRLHNDIPFDRAGVEA